MIITRREVTKLFFSAIACLLLLSKAFPAYGQNEYLCVWRNPERTMAKIFPQAEDYKTVDVKISDAQRKAIENKLGFELLPGQREKFQYFEMTGENGRHVGTIIAASQKGEYGAVEFVFGLDTTQVIKDLYIQRSRERDQKFKERSFLDLFVGVKIGEALSLEKRFTGARTPGITAVIQGLSKELVAFNDLVLMKVPDSSP